MKARAEKLKKQLDDEKKKVLADLENSSKADKDKYAALLAEKERELRESFEKQEKKRLKELEEKDKLAQEAIDAAK